MIIFILLYRIISSDSEQTFAFFKVTPSSSTVAATSTYRFDIGLSVPITAGSTIQIIFPTEYPSIPQGSGSCYVGDQPSLPTPCSISSKTLTFPLSSSYAIDWPLVLSVDSILNPENSITTGSFQIFHYTNNVLIQDTLTGASVYITPFQMPSASISTSSQVIAANSTWTVSFTITKSIPAGGRLEIVTPIWNFGLGSPYNRYYCGSTISCAGVLSKSYVDIQGSLSCSCELGTVIILLNSGLNAGSTSVNIGLMANPPSGETENKLFIRTKSGLYYIEQSADLSLTVTGSADITIPNISASRQQVSVETFYYFKVVCNAPISSEYIMTIWFPNEFTLGSNFNIGGLVGIKTNPELTISNNYVTMVAQFTNYINEGSQISFYAYKITNPFSTKPSSPITITITTGSLKALGYSSQGYSLTATSNSFTSISITALDPTIYTTTTYAFSFNISTRVSAGSYLRIIIPKEISMAIRSTATCENIISGFKSSALCGVSGSVLTIVNCFSANFSGIVSFGISAVTNPTTTAPTSVFELNAISEENYLILYDNSYTFTAGPGLLTSAHLISSSYMTGAISTYTLSFTISHQVPSGGVIYISLPTQVSLIAPTCSSPVNLSSFYSCSFSSNTLTIINGFTNAFISGSLGISISGVKNPGTTQESDSFQLFTKYNSLVIDSLLQGVTTKMTTANTFTAVSIATSSNTIGAMADFSVTITPNNPMYNGGTVVIDSPVQVGIPVSPVCEVISGTTRVQCSINSNSDLEAVLAFPSEKFASAFSFRIKACKNPGTSKVTDSFLVYSFINSYSIDATLNGIALTVTNPGILTVTVTLADTGISVATNYAFSITPSNLIPDTSYFEIKFPSSFTLPSTASCTGISLCSLSDASTIIVNYSGSSSQKVDFTLNSIKNPSAVGSFQLTVNSKIQTYSIDSGTASVTISCHSPCSTCQISADTCITCLSSYPYYYQSFCYAKCPSGSTSVQGNACMDCLAPCSGCSVTTSNCTSCASPYFLLANKCVTSCGTGMYQNNRICSPCMSNCDNCTQASSCLNCSKGYSYTNGECSNLCPSGYLNINSLCVPCISCKTCSGQLDICTSCDSGYSLYNQKCVSSCPSNFTSISQACVACDNRCASCSTSASYCTKCQSYLYLYNGACLQQCPKGTIASLDTCINCNSSCTECISSPDNCVKCQTGLVLSNNNCINSCPEYSTAIDLICTNCTEPCSNCNILTTNCTKCSGGYLLYKNQCIGSCPMRTTIKFEDNCTDCLSPCFTCDATVNTCTSCIDSYYLYNGTCVIVCPEGYNQTNSSSCTIYECAPGCSFKELTNGVCDETCNNEICEFDHGSCSTNQSDAIQLQKAPLPFTITSAGTGAIISASKFLFPATSLTSATIGIWGVIETGSWLGVLNEISSSQTTKSRRLLSSDPEIQLAFILLLLCAVGHFFVNITFTIVYFYNVLQKDSGHRFWLSNRKMAKWIILPLAGLISFKFIRMLDVKLFGLSCFSANYDKKANLYKPLILFSYISIILTTLPTLGCLVYILVIYSKSSIAFALALDSLILTVSVLSITIYDVIILSLALAEVPRVVRATVDTCVTPPSESMNSQKFTIFNTKADETGQYADADLTGKIFPEPEDENAEGFFQKAGGRSLQDIWNTSFNDMAPARPPKLLDVIPEENEIDLSNAEIDETQLDSVIVNHKPSGRRIIVQKTFHNSLLENDPDKTPIDIDEYLLESIDKENVKRGIFKNKTTGKQVVVQRNFDNATVVDVQENGNWQIGKIVRRENEFDFPNAFQDPDDPEAVVVWHRLGKAFCVVRKDFKGLPRLDPSTNLPLFSERLVSQYDPKTIELDRRNVHFANLIVDDQNVRARRNFIGGEIVEVLDNEKYNDKKNRRRLYEPEFEIRTEDLEEPEIVLPTPDSQKKFKKPKRPSKPKPKGWENIEAIYLQRLGPVVKTKSNSVISSYQTTPAGQSQSTTVYGKPIADDLDFEIITPE